VQLGLIGAGNMAAGLARGWGRPLLCTDLDAARAQALAEEVGGEAVASNAELAERADLVVLCHKPPGLAAVAEEVAPHAKAVVSILASTTLDEVRAAYPDRPVWRVMPSVPVALRQGVCVMAAGPPQDRQAEVEALFAELGTLVTVEDRLVDAAMGLMSCAPAYYALVAEAQVDAGVRHGIPPQQAAAMVAQTMLGSAALLQELGHDTLQLRRSVTSPGGTTARGLDALERGGLRKAFSDALDAVLQTGSHKP
jgi:pyrroline-5-carboxylate reductase